MAKKIFVIITIIALSIPVLYITSSCTPTLEFGDLTVCSEIDPETAEPKNTKDVFSIEDSNLYAAIKVSGVKADENYRFAVTKKETGEVVFDQTNKYSAKEQGYVEGYFYVEYEGVDNKLLMDPGVYEVNFYHKGELIDSTSFEITAPEVKILEVTLASSVDENSMAPIDIKDEFKPEDTVYAAVRINNNVEGDYFKAKWYFEDVLINQTELAIEENYFDDSYIAFSLYSDQPWDPGNYSVEIYHQDDLYGEYNFIITPPEEETAGQPNPFAEGLIYSNQAYNLVFAVPDNWQVKETEDEGGLTIELLYNLEQIPLAFTFVVSTEQETIPEDQFAATADDLVAEVVSPEWELLEKTEGEFVNAGNVSFDDYTYVYNDPDGNEWTMVFDFFKGKERTYIFFTISLKDYYETATPIYEGIVASFNYLQ